MAILLAASCQSYEVYTKRELRESPIVLKLRGREVGVMPVKLKLGGVSRGEEFINITFEGEKYKKIDPWLGKVAIWTDSLWKEFGADSRLLAQELSDYLMNRLLTEEIFWIRMGEDGSWALSNAQVDLSNATIPVTLTVAPDAQALPHPAECVIPVRKVTDATVDCIIEIEVSLGWDVVQKIDAEPVRSLDAYERQPAKGDLYLMKDFSVEYAVYDTLTGKALFTDRGADRLICSLNKVERHFLTGSVTDKTYPSVLAGVDRDWLTEGRRWGKEAIDGIIPMFRPMYSQMLAARAVEKPAEGSSAGEGVSP